jgi:hypothetical protein
MISFVGVLPGFVRIEKDVHQTMNNFLICYYGEGAVLKTKIPSSIIEDTYCWGG